MTVGPLKTSQILTLTAVGVLAGRTLIAGSSTDAPTKAGDVNEAESPGGRFSRR